MVESMFESAVGLSRFELGLDLRRLGGKVDRLDFCRPLVSNGDTIMSFIPCLERMSINQHNGPLDQGLCADKLVVGGIVGNVEHTNFASANFRAPRKVSAVKSEGTKFLVSAATANFVNARLANLGHGRRTSELKLALLAVLGATASRLTALVPSFASNTLQLWNEYMLLAE